MLGGALGVEDKDGGFSIRIGVEKDDVGTGRVKIKGSDDFSRLFHLVG
jgi:hypothetical protein